MQLFTIGLLELNRDGTLRRDGDGNPIETYTQNDVTELAKVFTGLHRGGTDEFGTGQFFEDRASDICLLYTSPSPRDGLLSRMPSSA